MNQRLLKMAGLCISSFLILGLLFCGSKEEKSPSSNPSQLENTTASSSTSPQTPQPSSGGGQTAVNDGKISAIELAKRIFVKSNINSNSNPGGILKGYLVDYDEENKTSTKLDAHAGIDFIAKPAGIYAVYSLVTGKVKMVEDGTGYGTFSVYSPSKNATFIYLHLDRLDQSAPKVGKCITQGQIIGYTGARAGAWVTTPHLHLEVRKGDKVNGLSGAYCSGQCTKGQVENETYDPRAIDTLTGSGSDECTTQPNDTQNGSTQSSTAGNSQTVNTSSSQTTSTGNAQTTSTSSTSVNTTSTGSQTTIASNQTTDQTSTSQTAASATQPTKTVTIISGNVLMGYIGCDATTPAVFRVTTSINGNSDVSMVIDKPDGLGLKKPGTADLKQWVNSTSITISSADYDQGEKPSFANISNSLSTSSTNQLGIVLTSDDGTASCTPDWVTIQVN